MVSTGDTLAIYWSLAVIEIAAVALRVYSKWRRTQTALELSDRLLIVCCMIALVGSSLMTYLSTVDESNWNIHGRVTFAGTYQYYVGIYATKAAIISMHFHALAKLEVTELRRTLWGILAYNICAFVAIVIQETFTCWPIQRNWNITDYCTPLLVNSSFITASCLNITCDLLLLAFSIRLLVYLHLPRHDQLAYSFILVLGGVSIVAALIRFGVLWSSYLRHVDAGNMAKFARAEVIYASTRWGAVEIVAGVVAACLPSFRAWWRWLLQRTEWKFTAGSASRSGGMVQDPMGNNNYEEDRVELWTMQSPEQPAKDLEARRWRLEG